MCVVSLSTLAVGSFLALFASGVFTSEVRAGMTADALDKDSLAAANAFDGEYVFVGGQKERDGVDAAIETSVAAVSALVRNLGRTRLREANVIPERVTIAVDGDVAKISMNGSGHEASLDGTAVKSVGSEGDKVKVSHRMRGASLIELIDGAGGDRTNTFKLNADGSRLTMYVEISSGQLPVPVEYRLTYKRK